MNLETILAVAGLITVAAITPGPNNFIVLERSLRGGFLAGLPAIAGVIVGTQLLLLLIWLGADALFTREPEVRRAMTLAGAAYLIWLGLTVVRQSFQQQGETKASPPSFTTSFRGLVLFQFLNPKSWVLVLTASAAMAGGLPGLSALVSLAGLFLSITGICLVTWAAMGAALTHFLADPARGRWFDRFMGAMLVVSAGMLVA